MQTAKIRKDAEAAASATVPAEQLQNPFAHAASGPLQVRLEMGANRPEGPAEMSFRRLNGNVFARRRAGRLGNSAATEEMEATQKSLFQSRGLLLSKS